ncbi:MAG TPA: response regulator [Roseiflexaceae bacterium]|jgi:two-component system chemotaxis response regulator CheY|nr:response regulator [Roseiflexaceae bacterium]
MSFANDSASSEQGIAGQNTVLIVEDDVATRRLYKFLLTNGGYNVVEAEDGVVALEQLEKHRCQLIITDMNMPRMDGLQLIKKIREHYSTIHIIVITAFGTPDTERQALRFGANDYLPKPFDFEELERRVHTALETRTKER